MSKIICDICGTRYPDTSDQCPICGHIRESAGTTAEDVLFMEEIQPETRAKVSGGRFSKSNVQKRNEGKMPYEDVPVVNKETKATKAAKKAEDVHPGRKEEPEFTEDKQNKKANMILNILLEIVILALLIVTGYIFTQFVLPEIRKPEPTVAPTETQPVITQPLETAEPTFPCEELILDETEHLFIEYEEKRLINAEVKPANTTDKLTFTSGNELIATVDAEGCITALAEGQTVITVACGDVKVEYNVVCLFPGIDIKPGEVPTDPPPPPPTEPPQEWTVTSKAVNVRTGPNEGYDAIRSAKRGEVLLVYEVRDIEGRLWGRIEEGWLCLDYASKNG
jgi:hypothetical protein